MHVSITIPVLALLYKTKTNNMNIYFDITLEVDEK